MHQGINGHSAKSPKIRRARMQAQEASITAEQLNDGVLNDWANDREEMNNIYNRFGA